MEDMNIETKKGEYQQLANIGDRSDLTNTIPLEPKTHDQIIDDVLDKSGGMGRYQIYAFIFGLFLLSNNTFLLYNISFFIAFPAFQCYNSQSSTWDICERERACELPNNEWRVDFTNSKSYYNWIYRLDIYCVPSYEVGLIGSMLFAGQLFGMLLLVPLSDKFGRKPMLIVNAWGQMIAFIGFIFISNLDVYYVLMFLMGAIASLNPCVGQVYIVEVVPKKYETLILTLSSVLEGIPMLIGPIYFISGGKDTETLVYCGAGVCALACLTVFALCESPRFLLATKQLDKCDGMISYIAKFNGKPVQNLRSVKSYLAQEETLPLTRKEQISKFKLFIKNSAFQRNLVIIICLWVVQGFNFNLLNFYLANMAGDLNYNSLYSSISLLTAFFVAGFIIQKIGYRWSFVILFGLSFTSGMVYIFIPNKSDLAIAILISAGRFGISPIYSLAFLCQNNLFPDEIKASLFGLFNVITKLICMSAPIVAQLKDPIPMIFFSVLSVLCGLTTHFIDYKIKEKLEVQEAEFLRLLEKDKDIKFNE